MAAELPEVLPIFPLSGVLLLPGGRLPLHVFEPRYRNMVEDVLAADSWLGVIQPIDTTDMIIDDLPDADADRPDLYEVGCAGTIERCDTLPDGRHMILLQGIQRFRIRQELELCRGYRRIEPDYSDFVLDELAGEAEVPADRLMKALADFGEDHRITFELDKLRELPGLALLNSVAMVLPFPPAEKQALLEAANVEERYETLLTLMDMGIELHSSGESPMSFN